MGGDTATAQEHLDEAGRAVPCSSGEERPRDTIATGL